MKFDSREIQAVAAAQPARVDLYVGIHKALRALMADTLLDLGRMDTDDTEECDAISGRILELLDFCTKHLKHENDFIHTAIEARATGASSVIAHEHDEHVEHISRLTSKVSALRQMSGAQEASNAALDLYRELTLFVANNFQHMHVEETAHNVVLWARYTDAELLALHDRLLASIPPAEMMYTMRWLVPYMNPTERTNLLKDMQAHAPVPAFEATMNMLNRHLSAKDWAKLTRSLGLPPVPGLVTA